MPHQEAGYGRGCGRSGTVGDARDPDTARLFETRLCRSSCLVRAARHSKQHPIFVCSTPSMCSSSTTNPQRDTLRLGTTATMAQHREVRGENTTGEKKRGEGAECRLYPPRQQPACLTDCLCPKRQCQKSTKVDSAPREQKAFPKMRRDTSSPGCA